LERDNNEKENDMKSKTPILTAIAALSLAGIARAGGPIDFNAMSVETNEAAVTTHYPSDPKDDVIRAEWLDTVIVNLSGYASPTCTVVVATAADTYNAARTLLTLANITADGVYPVRDLVTTQAGVDIANTPARPPLFQFVRCYAYAANSTGIVATVRLVTSDKP
jgi:hypothetical protein